MNLARPAPVHASTERLCDYELSELRPPALPCSGGFAELVAPGDLELRWWLWMNEMGQRMMRPYDLWRASLEVPAPPGATGASNRR